MPLIKRYPNRKLYDTEAKQYVTLEQIADLIRSGEDVQVVEYESGEDLTTLTLSQVILDQEKKQAGFLPRSLMTSLIRSGGDTFDSVLRALQQNLPQAAKSVEGPINALVAQGTLTAEQARSVMQALEATPHALDESVTRVLNRLNIPSGRDISDLRQRLAELHTQLEALTANEITQDESSHDADG